MFADNSLREDQALVAMGEDLRKTKSARNDLAKENACVPGCSLPLNVPSLIYLFSRQLKRKLAEMEFEKQQCVALGSSFLISTLIHDFTCSYEDMLRRHGLIS